MAEVIKAPDCSFNCHSCGAECRGQPHEFAPRNTMPPTWTIECPYCHCVVTCSPKPLIARLVGIGAQAFVVFALLLVGCGFDTELSVYAEPDLVGETATAIDAWNEALARGPCYGVELYPTSDVDADISVVWGDAHGWTAETISRHIELRRGAWLYRREGYIEATIAHELGHALGAPDLYNERNREDLMWWAVRLGRGPEPTGYDVAQVCAYVFQN